MKRTKSSKLLNNSFRDKKLRSVNSRHKESNVSAWHEIAAIRPLCYQRSRDLIAYLPLWPADLNDVSASGTKSIIDKIIKALHQERRRARARHWSYSLSRHIALAKAIKAERLHLKFLAKKQKSK